MSTKKTRKFFPQWIRNITDKDIRELIETEYIVDKTKAVSLLRCRSMKRMKSNISKCHNISASSKIQSPLGW